MIRVQEFVLPTRQTTVGHWRFRGDLLDDSGRGNHLTPVRLRSYVPGFTENGLTAIKQDGEFEEGGRLPAANATDFDFGTGSFTLEVLHKPIDPYTDWPIRRYTGDTGPGFMVGLTLGLGGYRLCIYLHDGTAALPLFSARIWTAQQHFAWEFWTIVVDRPNDQVRLYFNGIQDANSPFDIASLGSLSAPAANLDIGNRYHGEIDEVCISKEALTPAAIAQRVAGSVIEKYPDDDDAFLLRFLPECHQGNADLQEYLLPMTRQYRALKVLADQTRDLMSWDRCPNQFLDLLASRVGFELPHTSIASEHERRMLLRWAVWLYRHKGTVGAISWLLDALGYTSAITENYPAWVPHRANRNRAWKRSQSAATVFQDEFDTNLSKWNKPLSLASWWRLGGGRLLGTGDSSTAATSGISFNQSSTTYFLEAQFEVLSGFGTTSAMGIYLRYVDANNFARVELRRAVGVDYLMWSEQVGGVTYSTTLYSFPAGTVWSTGVHRLRIHVDGANHRHTIAFDNQTIVYQFHRSMAALSSAKKGLWMNGVLTVAFDLMLVQTPVLNQTVRTITSSWSDRSVTVQLTNSPANDAGKRVYLAQVLPAYLPAGVALTLT